MFFLERQIDKEGHLGNEARKRRSISDLADHTNLLDRQNTMFRPEKFNNNLGPFNHWLPEILFFEASVMI